MCFDFASTGVATAVQFIQYRSGIKVWEKMQKEGRTGTGIRKKVTLKINLSLG